MNNISATTKDIIKKYYNQKIIELRNSKSFYEDDFIKYKIHEFNTDNDVLTVRNLLYEINKRYDTEFSIELNKWRINVSNLNNVQKVQDEINELCKERDRLLCILDTFPKKSNEYKNAFKKLNEILEVKQ